MNRFVMLHFVLLILIMGCSQVALAQSPDLVCAEAARTLVDGSRSELDNASSGRSNTAGEIGWSTYEGHKGICRIDKDGRVYEIAVTQFPPSKGTEFSLSCASVRYARQECALQEPGTVRLDRQLSKSPCVQNQTWGSSGRMLWVDKGCSASFIVATLPAWEAYTQSCESVRDRRTECKLKGVANATISRQLSSTFCRLNSNWGVQDDLLWVDKGCRAVFRISPADNSGISSNVRTAAIRACDSTARSRGYEVLNVRVLEAEKNHLDVEVVGERNRVTVDLFCRYDTNTRQASIYGN